MISIITAIHNQLEHNKLYLESLRKYTFNPYEIIIIDNHSTDGSGDFFQNNGCDVITNNQNLCYPESMNQGIQRAKFDYLCFLNNDVWVGVHWDKYLVEAIEKHSLDIVSPMGIERRFTLSETARVRKKWNRIGRLKHLKSNETGLKRLIGKMYGDWGTFCREFSERTRDMVMEGIVGNCVFAKRSAMEKIGNWDQRLQSADWDISLNVLKRARDQRDIAPIKTVGGAYVHHFLQATLKNKPEPFACAHPRLNLYDKWNKEEVISLWPFPQEVLDAPSWFRAPLKYLKYKYKKKFLLYHWGDPY
ncbi:MAG: glycosyltransferase family 2 protein [Nitrospiria bacterium]